MVSWPVRSTIRLRWLGLVLLVGLADTAHADLVVGAASSLREPIQQIAVQHERDTGQRVRLVFGASSALAAQVRAGAPLDLLISADREITERLHAGGDVEAPQPFGSNRLVIAISDESGAPVRAPADLLQPSLRRLAVPAPAVPVGRYARAWLAHHGLLDRLRDRLVQTEHARATLAAVEQGHVDAAIVYRTDARRARRARVAFEIEADEHPPIRYAWTVVREGNVDSARDFAARFSTPEARSVLANAGFLPVATP